MYGANTTDRSEIASYKKLDYNQTYTISYKFMVEPGAKNTADWLVMGQLHQTEDAGDYSGPTPFAIEMVGEKMRVTGRYTTEQPTKNAPVYMPLYTDSTDLQRGHWYDMKIQVKLDPYGNGALDVWRDGTQLVHYNGALGYPDQVGPYWKEGVYRSTASESMAVQYTGFDMVKGT
ncbi:heparin lyase I family protein, partial [Microvirga sp. 2TAF3]